MPPTHRLTVLGIGAGANEPSDLDANESVAHRSSGPLRLVHLQRYGLALLSVGAALGTSLVLQHFGFRVPSALLLLFAVAISSWYGGQGPAGLAVLLSAITFYWYFVQPVRTWYIYWSQIPYFITFVAFAGLVAWFGTVRQRAEADLRQSRYLLGEKASFLSPALRLALIYAFFGALWILVSDRLLFVLVPEVQQVERLQTYKGWFFIAVTSVLLWLLATRFLSRIRAAEEALHGLNRKLRAISNCNQTLLRATDEQSLLEEICRIVCEEAGYRMAFVAYAEHDEAKSVRPVAWTGAEEGYLASVGFTYADTDLGRGPTGTAIRSGKTCCTEDFATDPRVAPWRESALQHGYRSSIALPLKDDHGKPFGSLTICSARPNASTPEEVRLLEELAGDLAFGVVTLRSQAARKQAEAEVTLLSFALDNVREAAFLIDETARFHYVNDAACRVLGYTRAELLAMSVPDIGPEFPGESWTEHLHEIKARRSLSFESRHRTKDGRIFPVEISANYFEYGGRAYNLALARDISERKRAEEALRRSRVYLAEGQRLSHTGSWAWSAVTRQSLYWSEEMCRIFGFDPQEGVPNTEVFWQRIHPEDFDATYELLMKAATESMEYEHKHRIVLPDGTVKHIHAIGHPVLDEKGQLAEYVGTAIDITERLQTEQALREQANLLSLTRDAIFVRDMEKQVITYWNRAAEEFYGWNRQEAIGKVSHDLLQTEFPMPLGDIQAELTRAGRWEGELVHTKKDGSKAVVASRWSLQRNEQGTPIAILETNNDIAERKRAEEALRRSETYLAEAQRLTHTGAWATNAVPEPLYWSEELYRLYGLDPACGLPSHDRAVQCVHPEDRDKYEQAFLRVVHQKVDSDVEFRIVLPDGAIRHLYGLGHPVLNAEGNVVEVVGTTVDITERKRAEEALHDSETRFRTFVDHAGDALFVQDLERRIIVDVNRQACDGLGYTRQELIERTPHFFHLDSDRAGIQAAAVRAAAGETVIDRHWHRRKDGSTFPVEVHTTLVSYGGRRFLLKVARDIADRLRAEEAIRHSERQLREVIEGIPAIASTLRLDGSLEFINKRWQEYTGMSAEESVGTGWQSAGHPHDMGHYLENRRVALASGDPFEDEIRIRSRDGKYRWFLLRGAPLRDEQENIVRWYTTAIDIDDRKRAEDVRLEERVRERTRIARELHDTLLQSFQGTFLLFQAASGLLPARTAEAKKMLDRAIHLAAQAITEGRDAIQGLRSTEVEMNDLAVAIRTFGESLAANSVDDGFPVFQVEVVGVARELDPAVAGEVYRIAIEALRNSFQHAAARHIKVEIHHEEKEFRVLVRDDGKGIDSKSLAADGPSGHYGLHGMRERAKLIGGEIVIRSEVGVGTEVELRVAAVTAYAAAAILATHS